MRLIRSDFSPLESQLLYNRGLRSHAEAQSFLNPDKSYVCDPMLLPDMDRAVARLRSAVERGERIGVFGDFDIDGVSGSAVVMSGMRNAGREGCRVHPEPKQSGWGARTRR